MATADLINPRVAAAFRNAREQETRERAAREEVSKALQQHAPELVRSSSPEELEARVAELSSQRASQQIKAEGQQQNPLLFGSDFLNGGVPVGILAEGVKEAAQGNRPDLVRMAGAGLGVAGALAPIKVPGLGRLAAGATAAQGGRILTSPVTQNAIRGTLGAAAGGVAAEAFNNPEANFHDFLNAATAEALAETAGAGLVQVGPALVSRFAKWAGVTSDFAENMLRTQDLANEASKRAGKELPVGLALQDVSPNPFITTTKNVLGRFGITNKPFREAGIRAAEGLSSAKTNVLMGLSPIVELLENTAQGVGGAARANKMAGRINKALLGEARAASDTFKRTSTAKYTALQEAAVREGINVHPATLFATMDTELRRLMTTSPDFVKVKDVMTEAKLTFDPKTLQLALREGTKKQKTLIQKQLDPDLVGALKLLDEWMNGAERLSPTQTFEKAGRISSELGELIGKTEGTEASKVYTLLKKAIRQDISNAIEHTGSPELKAMFKETDAFFRDNWNLFVASAGGRRARTLLGDFGQRAQKEIQVPSQGVDGDLSVFGGRSRRGEASATKVLIEDATPDELLSLRAMLTQMRGERGVQAWQDAVGLHVADVFDKAQSVVPNSGGVRLFSAARVKQSLGLDRPLGEALTKTRILLKGTKANPSDIEAVLDLTEKFFADGIPNMSDMATRRAVLGGIKTALGSVVPGMKFKVVDESGIPGTMINAVAVLKTYALWAFVRRKVGGQLMTDPQALKQLRILASDRFSQELQLKALRRLNWLQPLLFAPHALAETDPIGRAQEAMSGAVETGRRLVAEGKDFINSVGQRDAPPVVETPLNLERR